MALWTVLIHVYVMFAVVVSSRIPPSDNRKKREKSMLDFVDCGTAEKLIHFHHVDASPNPVIIPGTLHISMSGNVTSDLPRRVNVYMGMKKYLFGFPFTVPCLATGIGSCSYENLCASLEQYEVNGCPGPLRHLGFPCHCPFLAGDFSLTDIPLNIPKIQGFASTLLNGDYELELRISEEDGEELGCLHVKFSMKKRSKGWLFKI
ncbi:unnamed protein product [Candidula unifasciata]|uniref:MD-2-related lipid-recognition domain-containing protein n=1 Tax=Candidula unifasciata TaxID=100452 RepID=A0A8S3YHN9_9EUPU|nr:unnamed protein product [Candidula unifasciata]